jgi:hypothetical protein
VRSKFSTYKRQVRYYLIKSLVWETQRATVWCKAHPDYLKAQFSSNCPPAETARYIHTMKENNA